ncbi:MAG: hypothetical protein AAFP00_00490 [Bacteroidota bacterium]
MIIKATSRKDSQCFEQLVAYVLRDGVGEYLPYIQNMDGVDPSDAPQISAAFLANDVHRKKRKGGVCLHHVILAWHPSVREQLQAHPEKLYAIISKFLELRCPEAGALTVIHDEKEHVHAHVVFSATAWGHAQSMRMSKRAFQECKEAMERFLQERYPELLPAQRERRSVAKVNDLSEAFRKVLEQAVSYEHCVELLMVEEMTFYSRRRKLAGVLHKGKKYRFSRLLYSPEHVRVLEILQQEYQFSKELEHLSEQRNEERMARGR